MLLYAPKDFDANEWFILIAAAANILVFWRLPRRLPKEITPLIVLLSMSFPKLTDHTIGVSPYDLYNITDEPVYGVFDVLLYGVYPLFGYLFLYFYEVFQLEKIKLVLYFVVWSLFAVGFEWFLVKIHVFTYHGWRLIYSLPTYLITLSLLFLLYKYLCSCRDSHAN